MKKKNILIPVLTVVFAGLFLFSAWKLWGIRSEYRKSGSTYDELTQAVVSTPEPTPAQKPEETEEEKVEVYVPWPSVDFTQLNEINTDAVGWLQIGGTIIDYPVVQGRDNWYYLGHLITGEPAIAGCLMLDCANESDFSDPNSVIYAHHMQNGTLFGQLENYRKEGFFEEHPYAYLLTPEKNYVVRFFAGVLTTYDAQAWNLHLEGEVREEWLRFAKANSSFDSPVTPAKEDRILTLSTCSNDGRDLRYVMLGVLEAEGEIRPDFVPMEWKDDEE